MAELKEKIHLSKDFPRATFTFLMDCEGYTVASKFLTKMVTDYSDLKYREKQLSRENAVLKSILKKRPKK